MNSFAVRQDAPGTDQERLDALVASVCRVADQREDVRAIFVITTERPTFHALMRYRAQAGECGLTLTMLGTGGVVVRRHAQSRNDNDVPPGSDDRARRNAE